MSHPLAPYLKRFFSHYLPLQKGLSPQSLAAYRDAVKLLLCYSADQLKVSVDALEVESLSPERVSDFLDHLEQERGCCTATRNARLAAIRTLFAFIAREEPELIGQCQAIRALPLKRTTHTPVTYLEESEMQTVLGTVDLSTRTGVRDQALLLLLYNTGARVSEIVGLTVEDLHLNGATAQVQLLGKGGKTRSCPLWPETVEALEAYLQQRQPKDPHTTQLFLNANGSPITRFGIRYITRHQSAQPPRDTPYHRHAPAACRQRHHPDQLLARARRYQYHPPVRGDRYGDEAKDARACTGPERCTPAALAAAGDPALAGQPHPATAIMCSNRVSR